ncbi:hypothetical protein PLESTB_001268000 [Pleodorina starrii]|uniref:Tyrosinase copper-binding domain-containing protein n=1 Tax=Pleodorina starrii TaxID=330485 RepID=A0A9W6BT77_9CHLO|nr:hypothetical protein PLESTM_000717000 [Pleodorina starrii]GLC57797.1 hypothetical protein PLESTB_001268000 [Pleodorina starrii]
MQPASCPCAGEGLVVHAATNVNITYNNNTIVGPGDAAANNAAVNSSQKPSGGGVVPPSPLGPSSAVKEPVIRREFRTLPKEEQERFCDAMEKMMELRPEWLQNQWLQIDPAAGPPPADQMPCEFFRLASYHGWPFWSDAQSTGNGLCAHGIETFPVWHRAYMVDFERSLQAADRALGRDGRIALHYWGWEYVQPGTDDPTLNGQVMPQMIRDRFPSFKTDMIPLALIKTVPMPPKGDTYSIQDLISRGYSETSSEEVLKHNMQMYQLHDHTYNAMGQLLHSRAASTAGMAGDGQWSLEQPHNMLHNACDFPMSDVPYAAFHPLFWLHHSNVDRQYEAFLRHTRGIGLNPEGQFSKCDQEWFSRPLTPFTHPTHLTGNKPSLFYPTFAFNDTRSLGYDYDDVPVIKATVPKALQQGSQPNMAILEDVDPKKFRGRSLNFHFFIVDKKNESFPPLVDPREFKEQGEQLGVIYAGMDALFSAKEGFCPNCDTRGLLTMKTNVSSEELLRHGLGRDEVRVKVVIQELGPKRRMFTPEDLGLSQPKLVGPLIDLVAVAAAAAAAAAPNGNGNGNGAAAAPHRMRLLLAAAPDDDEPAAVAAPSPATLASITQNERLQANKFLALLGYQGAEKRDSLLAGGDVEEPQPQLWQPRVVMSVAAAAAAPAAAAASGLAPAAGDAATRMRRLQEQLGLPNATGALDENTLKALANRHRYNTYPEKDLLGEYETRTFANGATVYWSIDPPCYMAGTDTSTAESVMQRCCQQWQAVTNLTFRKVDDDHPEADLKVMFLPFKDYVIDPNLDILDVGPDFEVFPHHLSVVATSPDKGLPPVMISSDGPKKPLPLPGRQGSAKIMIDTTWAFWMLPTTSQRVHDFYGAFYLAPLLLHNIGSALGLHSSGEPGDVMCPFYSEDHTTLTDNDKQRAKNLYPTV